MSGPHPTLPDKVAKRPLHFFWLVDWSGSMAGKKIAALNQAIREAMPEVEKALTNHPQVRVLIRCIKFADTAEWHIGPDPVELSQFSWPDLSTDGQTATAQAIKLLCSELEVEKMPGRGYPPVCVLISDGFCTEPPQAYHDAIACLDSLPWGRRAVRLAIGVGDESGYDEDQLGKFHNQKEVGILKAHTVDGLVQYIKWASVTPTLAAVAGKSRDDEEAEGANVMLQSAPPKPIASVEPGEPF